MRNGQAVDREDFPIEVEPNRIETSPLPAVNVAAVPQRSPLRYPGGKTWLIPHIRWWLNSVRPKPRLLIEPFAGGGIVSLTAVMENLVGRCLMAEVDHDVAAFWHAVLRHGPELRRKVLRFIATRESVDKISNQYSRDLLSHGFRTLVLNRTRRGGILAPGASISRAGENGKGVASRWYPETLADRLLDIAKYEDRIGFCETDGVKLLDVMLEQSGSDAVVFVDPPYTAGGKKAGKRLYAHNDLDHDHLFHLLFQRKANFLMTYDQSSEIMLLVQKYGFHTVQVMMKNTHHARIPELVITPHPVFLP